MLLVSCVQMAHGCRATRHRKNGLIRVRITRDQASATVLAIRRLRLHVAGDGVVVGMHLTEGG